MAKTPINEQFIKMQKLAGVITESQYVNQINEMYLDDPATVWNKEEEKGGLPFEEKESILLPFLDGAEDINMWANTSFDNLEDNMKTAVRKYLTSPPKTNPNNYTDDYGIERDKSPFGDDAMFESKILKLRQFIREEVEKELTKTEEKEIFDALLNDYQRKGVKALVDDERYTELKEKNKKLAADLLGKVRRRAEGES
jgi:hypothetical protein